MLTASSNSFLVSSLSSDTFGSLLFQRTGLVHRVATALLAADFVLRLVRGSFYLAARFLGVRRDLLLDLALGGAAVALPGDLVALLEFFVAHVGGLPAERR